MGTTGNDPSELIRELLRVSRELEALAELGDEARSSTVLLTSERERILAELRLVMRGSEAPPQVSIPPQVSVPPAGAGPSGIRTRSGQWVTPSPNRSRRKGPR